MPKKKLTPHEDFQIRAKALMEDYMALHGKYHIKSQLVVRFPTQNLGLLEKFAMYLLVKRKGILDIELQDVKK